MTTVTAIDATLAYTDNSGPVGADLAQRRLRHLTYLTRVYNYVYLYRPWWFRRTSPTVTVAALASSAVLPASFSSIGFTGGLYNTVTGKRLTYVDMQELTDLREGPAPLVTDDPEVYSVAVSDTATTYRPTLQVPKTTLGLSLKAWMDGTPPVLDESSGSNNLKVIPEHYHELVLIPGVRALAQAAKTDMRFQSFLTDPEFQEGLKLMVINETLGRDTARALPSFWGG